VARRKKHRPVHDHDRIGRATGDRFSGNIFRRSHFYYLQPHTFGSGSGVAAASPLSCGREERCWLMQINQPRKPQLLEDLNRADQFRIVVDKSGDISTRSGGWGRVRLQRITAQR
jgi:hypothetical protein